MSTLARTAWYTRVYHSYGASCVSSMRDRGGGRVHGSGLDAWDGVGVEARVASSSRAFVGAASSRRSEVTMVRARARATSEEARGARGVDVDRE